MPTANEEYWNNFTITDQDIERLYDYVLERSEPTPTHDLVQYLIEARVKDEEARRARYAEHTTLYQPKLDFQIGQRLIFSALGDAAGTVLSIRPAENPRLPAFKVITVQFEGDGSTREFAAAYELPHRLNEEQAVAAVTTDLTAEQVYEEYGPRIEGLLLVRLRREKEFVEREGRWLLRGLLTPVHEGYLNLAEAAIDQANAAVPTSELLNILELRPDGVKPATVSFSLEHALENDERFVNVGPSGQARWFLTRLEPAEAHELPRILRRMPDPPPFALPPELEAFVEELEGEAEATTTTSPRNTLLPVVTVALTYPHRVAGTLPLTGGLRALFPESDNPTLMITLVDQSRGTRIPAWIVFDGDYIAGLKTFYDQRKLNPGAYIQLTKLAEPLTLGIDAQAQRERSLWVRVARVQAGQLTFTQEKKPVAHKYDEEMLILIGDPAGLEALHTSSRMDRPLESLLSDIFPELAKLVPGGRVHAKTLFAAVNFARRVGPRAVFTALVQSPNFVSTGGGYFVLETARDMVR